LCRRELWHHILEAGLANWGRIFRLGILGLCSTFFLSILRKEQSEGSPEVNFGDPEEGPELSMEKRSLSGIRLQAPEGTLLP
jgi:hypothetical protein